MIADKKDEGRESQPDSANGMVVHEYDGIIEHDNVLPRWWVGCLFGTIVFAFGYWMFFHTYDKGQLPSAAYAERKAVDAALDCQAALAVFNRDVVADYLPSGQLGTRIGVATGYAIAGNMGSAKRLNYTLTGDMVNLAARLEGANKEYGTAFMISELSTAGD